MTETRPQGWLAKTLAKLTADDATIDAQELQSGCQLRLRAGEHCQKGKVVSVTGRLRSVVYTPRETVPTLEAELFDGSGSVTAGLAGPAAHPGIEPGAR